MYRFISTIVYLYMPSTNKFNNNYFLTIIYFIILLFKSIFYNLSS